MVECPVDDGDGFGHAAMSAEHAFASQGKLRHVAAGLAQRTTRNRRRGSCRVAGMGRCR